MFRTMLLVTALAAVTACSPEKDTVATDDAPLIDEVERSPQSGAQQGELAMGEQVEGQVHFFTPYHLYTFDAYADDAVFIDLANRDGADPYLYLFRWTGTAWSAIARNDDCYAGTLNACLRTVLPETTTYAVLVTTYEYAAWRQKPTMDYHLALYCENDSGACNGAPEPDLCGSRGLPSCASDTYCDWSDDACGAADVPGTCEPIPEICPTIYAPVCGCDGITYSSECFAARAGVDMTHIGECAPAVQSCGGWLGETCGADSYCDYVNDSCGAGDQSGICEPLPEICTMIYAPVCGCDGRTYSSECFAAREGVDVLYFGECR